MVNGWAGCLVIEAAVTWHEADRGRALIVEVCSECGQQFAKVGGFSELGDFHGLEVAADKLHPPDALLGVIELDGGSGVAGGITAENGPASQQRRDQAGYDVRKLKKKKEREKAPACFYMEAKQAITRPSPSFT